MQDNKQIVVSLSGFSDDEQIKKYLQMLSEIGCKYVKQLSKDVNYLIVNHTCTEKYKIAQLKASSTQTLTIQWLKESHRQKKLLPIQKYKIVKIFYGARIVIEGFQDKKIQSKIIDILKNNGAQEVREGVLGMVPQQLNSNYQVIIVPNITLYRRLQAKVEQFLAIPLVTPQWVEESLKSKKCKYPHDYALNYHNICNISYESRPNLQRLNKKIKNYLELQFLNSHNGLFCDQNTGEQFIILLDPNSIEKQMISLMQKLICLNNGLYLNSYSPAVTHILVGPLEENDHYKLMNHGDSVLILRVQWIIDCILFSQKLPENDYKVRSYKSPLLQYSGSLNITDSNINQYSQSFLQSYQISLKNTNSMGIGGAQTKSQTVANIVATKSKALKTEIFKGKFFHIDQKQKKETPMQSMIIKIKENGGCPISQSTLPSVRNKMIFLILKDSSENTKIIQKVRKLVSKEVPLIPLSIRWIEQCSKKQEYLDFKKQNYFTYHPFSFETPVREFMSIKIEILGIDQILKRRYKELLNALGVSKVSPNIAEITHCLCGDKYESDSRYCAIVNVLEKEEHKDKEKETVSKDSSASKNISMGMNRIKFIKAKWLMDYLNSSGKVSIDQYLIGQ